MNHLYEYNKKIRIKDKNNRIFIIWENINLLDRIIN